MPLRSTFAVSGGGELSLVVTKSVLLEENKWNGNTSSWVEGVNQLTSSKNLSVTLTGEPGTTCSYNIYYKDLSLDSTIIRSWDFLLRIFKNNQMIISYDPSPLWQTSSGSSKISPLFSGSSSPYNGAKPTITIPSGNTIATDDWKFMLYFHNREWDQSYLADKTLKGEFYIGDVVCS